MIPAYFIRSTLFNACYYMLIATSCILMLPTLILPRRFFLGVVHYFVHTTAFLERILLGLKYEIRGLENLPKDQSYIVASKHQSAYETTKLHILFKDPAIVLKRELLRIPLWGWYLAKSDQIAIDRSTPKKAIESIKSEAKRVAAHNRPMVIFPQGTRVSPTTTTQERPYKIGIVRMQEATGLPIIPMALNSGTFYPRNAWIKRPGTVIFEFLKPIAYIEDTPPGETLRKIEMSVEEASSRLHAEALQDLNRTLKKKPVITIIILTTLCIAWTVNWFAAAHLTKKTMIREIESIKYALGNPEQSKMSAPIISGFPFKMKVAINQVTLTSNFGRLNAQNVIAQSWPFLGMPIDIKAKNIEVLQNNWSAPLTFQSIDANITHKKETLTINHSTLKHDIAQAEISGTITEAQENPHPKIDLNIAVFNHANFIDKLHQKSIINKKARMVATFALNAMISDGAARTTLTSQDNKIYMGMIKIYEFPTAPKGQIRRRKPMLAPHQ